MLPQACVLERSCSCTTLFRMKGRFLLPMWLLAQQPWRPFRVLGHSSPHGD